MSDLVVDIQVDKLISWKDLKQGGTRFERMLDEVDFENEVLPLSVEYCMKHTKSGRLLWSTMAV